MSEGPEVTKEKRWRDAFGPNQTIQRVRPRESREYLRNPHKGTTTFQRFNGAAPYPGLRSSDDEGPVEFKPFDGDAKNPDYPNTTVSYCRWVWSVMEPEQGKYRWDILDGALEAARVRGQTLQIRMQPYTTRTQPPAWLWELGCGKQEPGKSKAVVEPDCNDPVYVKEWGRMIRSLGERYDGHQALESVDVAVGGPWAEGGGNATNETVEALVDLHVESFEKTQLLANIDNYQFVYGIRKGFGWRCDCFGDLRKEGHGVVPDGLSWNHMHDAYPKNIAEAGAQDAWRHAPVTMETCGNVGTWHKWGYDIDWIIEQGYKYHLSVFMPKSVAVPAEWMEKIEAFGRRMGYRFVLRQLMLPIEAKPGQRTEIPVWIDNVGCAPIYRPYRFAFRFRQGENEAVVFSKADIRKWMPDHTWFSEEITFPEGLEKGEVKLDVGIVDDEGKPRVRLAIEGALEDGWHPLTSVDVV